MHSVCLEVVSARVVDGWMLRAGSRECGRRARRRALLQSGGGLDVACCSANGPVVLQLTDALSNKPTSIVGTM